MPGVMLIFCLHHGTLLGWNIMHNHESPRTVFEIMFSRWKVAPEVVVYDNACNLAKFCLSREYAFFKHTKFVIDRLHMYSHKACSPVFNPNFHSALTGYNTQICEQFNRALQGIKTQLVYFNWENWIFHMSVYIRLVLERCYNTGYDNTHTMKT